MSRRLRPTKIAVGRRQHWQGELRKFFSSEQFFEQFKEKWEIIEQKKRRKPLDVPQIVSSLVHASIHAELVKDQQAKLNNLAAAFFDRDAAIREIIVKLSHKLARLYKEKTFNSLLDLAVRRSHPIVHGPGGLTGTVLVFKRNASPAAPPAPDPDTTVISASAVEIWTAFTEFVNRYESSVKGLRESLRRGRGREEKPWIDPLMRNLREAGLTKEEANELSQAMQLRGKEAVESSRQTVRSR